jgi:protocatechuate 3,4-dioxygenase beta subunit
VKYEQYQQFKAPPPAQAGRSRLCPTPPDILGPFYKPGAYVLQDGKLADAPALRVEGRVTDVEGTPLPANLDVWQANEKGEYDNAGFTLRGVVLCDAAGNYAFETVRPGHYQISDTEYRCPHIHVKVTAPGCKELVTQLYFASDEYNDADHWFKGVNVVKFPDGKAGRFDFVLEPAG